MELSAILERAKSWAQEAGESALAMQKHLGSIKFKNPKDVVTAADFESERIIVAHIQNEFPDHSIRTEEAGRVKTGARYEWIIDPVDGTVNFSHGLPLWGISIALVENTEEGVKPIVAVVNLPGLGKMFTAYKGSGTSVNGEHVHVSMTDDLSKSIVSNGDFNVGDWNKINTQNLKNFKAEAENCTRVKCFGSAVIEGAFTAQGSLDAFVMTMSYPWDIAAIALLVEEAGGRATEIDGSPIRFVDAEQVLFTNGILHQQFVQLLK